MIKKKNRVLITSVGGYFGKKNIEFLKNTNDKNTWVLATDTKFDREANKLADMFMKVPSGISKDYIPFIEKLIKKYKINFVIPCSDEEAIEYGKNIRSLNLLGAKIACQSEKVNSIITNKYKTYQIFKENKIPFSDFHIVYDYKQLIEITNNFYDKYKEFVVKSPVARGNRGTFVISNRYRGCKKYNESRELHMSYKYFKLYYKSLLKNNFPKLICERLFKPCYDLDVLCKNGKLFYTICRKRINPAGVPFKGNIIEKSIKLNNLAKKVCSVLNLSWLIDIDIMTNRNGDPVVLEVNPRASGSCSVSMMLGVPLYQNLLQIYEKKKLSKFKYPSVGMTVLELKH